MKEAIEGVMSTVRAFEAQFNLSLGSNWHRRLETLMENGFLRSDQSPTLAASVVRDINIMVHRLRAAEAGPGAYHMLDAGGDIIADAYAEANLYLDALTRHVAVPLDNDEMERAAALSWVYELGIEADRLIDQSYH